MDNCSKIATLALASIVVAGCHVSTQVDATLAGHTRHKLHRDQRMVLAPRVEVTKSGHFRFIEPIMCKRDILVEQVTHRTTIKKPNFATVVVGILSTTAGAVALLSSLGSSSDVLVGGGLVGIAVGLPLTIGPLIGNARSRELLGVTMSKRGRDYQRCAARGLKAARATLRHGKQRVLGSVAADGRFSVRVFDLFDAFAVHELPAIELEVVAGEHRFRTTLSPTVIAAGQAGFFKALNIDPRKVRLSKVPQPRTRNLTVTRIRHAGRVAIEVRATVTNDGIGDAWGVRGVITSDNPEIDGRMLYVGHLAAKSSRVAAVTINLSTDKHLSDAFISLLLRDHHGTTRQVPVKFGGPILDAR